MNKPVAWMSPDGKVSDTEGKLFYIPLYTHPPAQQWTIEAKFKELTDEEIWELHQEHIDEVTCGHSMKTVGFIDFAKAILRKAQEK